MSSPIRLVGAFLHKFSNGVSLNCPKSIAFPRNGLVDKSALLYGSSCWYSSRGLFEMKCNNTNNMTSVRRIWTCSPLCMGRRSSKIAERKNAQNAKKAKRYCKIGKEIVSAVKRGGPNTLSNTALATVIERAKELDVPKEIVDRNIKRASEKGQEAYIEKFYEVYGFGGAGMIVEVLTDKVNRSVAAVREVVKDCGGKMADPGSIMFKFRRARVVNVKAVDADKDQLLWDCIGCWG
ncbi:hypothetical protein IFM89_039264 [Coptis chinensis]|uniref:Uncharacterized protein n=1 Tax=Coptis chinensis TaxID=261450 RepID=A0A835IHN2_9MAGN|nr:hypothetical protein IFM89_039264 [Coptis chinensis]